MTINKKLLRLSGFFGLAILFIFPHTTGAGWAGAGGVPSTVTLSANPSSVESGDNSIISWSVDIIRPAQSPHNPALGCTKSGAWSGFIADTDGGYSGTYNTGNLTSDKTYNISCLVPGGDGSFMTITDSVTVSVGDTSVENVPENGYCGNFHGMVWPSHPTTGYAYQGLYVCSQSWDFTHNYPGHTDQGDTWNWKCKGSYGGTDASCFAYKEEYFKVIASASPSSGFAPLNNVAITADVSGSVTGNIQYKLDCTSDGTWEQTVTNTNDPYTFTTRCSYPNPGVYPVRVSSTRGGLTATTNTMVTVNERSLSLTASANPNYGPAPLNGVAITANVAGTASGSIIYKLDCTSDGTWEQTVTNTSDPYTFSTRCNYPDSETYPVTVEATRSGITRTATTTVTAGENPNFTIEPSASPSFGAVPLNDVSIISNFGGTATGPITDYKVDCKSDSSWEFNQNIGDVSSHNALSLCDGYTISKTYTVTVEGTRQGITTRETVKVEAIPVTATCSDGIQNQDETGVDTGGVCGGGGSATCSDGIQNQDETGIDTGGICGTGGGDPVLLNVRCYASHNSVRIGELVTWTAEVEGATPPYIYEWVGTNLNPTPTTNPFSKIYNTIGEKTASLRVSKEDGSAISAVTRCSIANRASQILRVYVDPDLEEF